MNNRQLLQLVANGEMSVDEATLRLSERNHVAEQVAAFADNLVVRAIVCPLQQMSHVFDGGDPESLFPPYEYVSFKKEFITHKDYGYVMSDSTAVPSPIQFDGDAICLGVAGASILRVPGMFGTRSHSVFVDVAPIARARRDPCRART